MIKQHSQNDEEKHIVKWFESRQKLTLRYLDIGAYTGLELSNTRRLAELGWSGVAVEPAAGPFRKLMENYKNLPCIDLVCVAIWTRAFMGFVEFQAAGDDAVGSLAESKEHIKTWQNTVEFQKTFVIAIPILELLSRFPPPFNFVNIDVEGLNWDIVKVFPFNQVGASLVCLETDRHREEMKALMAGYGFTEEVYESGENLIVGKP